GGDRDARGRGVEGTAAVAREGFRPGGRSEEGDGFTAELDVARERRPLLVGEALCRRIERHRLERAEVDGELFRHGPSSTVPPAVEGSTPKPRHLQVCRFD